MAHADIEMESILSLLQSAAPQRPGIASRLLDVVSPTFALDRDADRILFQVDHDSKQVRIGQKCAVRLQAHAFAASVILSSIATPGFREKNRDERNTLFAPADKLLTWAVGRDLHAALKQIEGFDRPLDEILRGSDANLPANLVATLAPIQRKLGQQLFRIAVAFIVLHELGHLSLQHIPTSELWSIEQEREADRYAAEWLLEDAVGPVRVRGLFGIGLALLWLTIFNVYLGPRKSTRHPESYDRLFQVLDQAINPYDADENEMIWNALSTLLFIHMDNAGTDFHPEQFQDGNPRQELNNLVDLLSKQDPY